MLEFVSHGDDRGQLIAVENGKEFDFPIQRFYYIFKTTKGTRRGFHAHKSLQQVLICICGSCKLHFDDGHETREVQLDSPDKGVYVGNNVWREMYDFSEDAVLAVLASDVYTEDDYIRDYDEFIKYVGGVK